MSNIQTENLKYCQDALELKGKIEDNFLQLAEHLYTIKEHNLFQPQWESFEEYCLEFKMSQNNINKLIQLYGTFIVEYELPLEDVKNAGVSLLVDTLPHVTSKKSAIKWVEKATTLTRADLRRELTEHKTGIDMNDCKHKNFYEIRICEDCGDKIRI